MGESCMYYLNNYLNVNFNSCIFVKKKCQDILCVIILVTTGL